MMTLYAELFSAAATKAETFLSERGFRKTRYEENVLFGSHCAEYTKEKNTLLLIWDEKEEWLRLTVGSASSGAHNDNELFFRGLRHCTQAEYERALAEAMNMLHNYFSPHYHDDDDDAVCMCVHHHT